MHRTQLLFPEALWDRVREQARAENRSAADLVREATERYLARASEDVDWAIDPLNHIVGGVRSGLGDLAQRHDDYLDE